MIAARDLNVARVADAMTMPRVAVDVILGVANEANEANEADGADAMGVADAMHRAAIQTARRTRPTPRYRPHRK